MTLKDLAARARSGDGEAFTQAILQIQTSLYRVARACLSSEEDIADAIQECMLKAWNRITDLQHPEYFKTWIIRILINEALRIRTRWKREIPFGHTGYPEGDMPDQTPGLPEPESDRQEWQPGNGLEFEAMIANLSEPLRIVIVLYYGEQYSVTEIAELLNLTKDAVRQRLARGRKQLKQIWSD